MLGGSPRAGLSSKIIARDAAAVRRSLSALFPVFLALALVVAYLPSLGAGFLNYDDPWLIRDNPYFKNSSFRVLGTILFDLSHDTRMKLGAEYLPVRDLSHWLEARLFGISAPSMRLTQLALYVGAMLSWRSALLRSLPNRWTAELAVWLFALHPVHVESVAWLAGRKDVLALLFVGAALKVHTGSSRFRALGVSLLFGLACLSKSMALGGLGIFVALDLLRRRKLDRSIYLGLGLTALVVLTLDVYVGRVVGMTTALAGGTRFSAWLTMGRIWLDYVKLCFWPPALSVSHDVVVLTSFDALAALGWLMLAIWAGLAIWRFRRDDPWPLALWLVFVVPLLPVSQILFPLENLIADRYLFISVLSPCLMLAALAMRVGRAGLPAVVLLGLTLWTATALRAREFADSVALFVDATKKTTENPIAPYQLGQALEEAGDDAAALDAYRLALARAAEPSEATRRATNNAAKLLARKNRLDEAERLLTRGRKLWPSDPKILKNLARVVARQGRRKEACELARQLAQRFGDKELEARWAAACPHP